MAQNAVRGKTGRTMERLMGLMEVTCIGWEKAAGTSMGLAITAINMATLGATALRCQSKTRLVNNTGATKGGGKDQGGKWGGTGGKGWDYGEGFGNQWGKGWQSSGNRSFGKGFGKKGLNEMGGNGWDLDDVWFLNGIHLLTAGATLAQKDNEMECHAGAQVNLPVADNWNPIPTQNRFSVFQETEGDG